MTHQQLSLDLDDDCTHPDPHVEVSADGLIAYTTCGLCHRLLDASLVELDFDDDDDGEAA